MTLDLVCNKLRTQGSGCAQKGEQDRAAVLLDVSGGRRQLGEQIGEWIISKPRQYTKFFFGAVTRHFRPVDGDAVRSGAQRKVGSDDECNFLGR